MLPEPVIDREVTRQPVVAFLGVLEGHRIGPFIAEGLDKAFGLAVGARRIRPGADVLEAKGAAGLGKAAREVSRTVVRHHLAALHALAVKPGHSPAQEADRCGLLFVRQHFHVGEPHGVVDRHMDSVVADAGRAALLSVASDAVADLAKASQLLDVDMDQVSGMLPLVTLQVWARDSATGPAPGDSELCPRWRRERRAAGQCGAGAAASAGGSQRAAVAADQASTAGCAEHLVDPPEQLRRLSGSGPATCRHSAGRSPLLQTVRAETGSHAGVEKAIATGLDASGGHWRVYAWGVRSRLGGDTSTGSDLTPHWLLTNLLRQNT